MEIFIFTDSQSIESYFSEIKKFDEFTINIHPVSDFKKAIKYIHSCDLIYLDISSMPDDIMIKMIKIMYSSKGKRFGVIDPEGKTKSISALFHNGIIDYVGPHDIEEKFDAKRLEEILTFRECRLDISDYDNIVLNEKNITVDRGWEEIEENKEYTFCIMFIRLENFEYIKKNHGPEFAEELISKFREYVTTETAAIDGKIWRWDDPAGLVVFPFNGKSCDAIMASFKMIRDRILLSVEICTSPQMLDLTIILHLGNMVYKPVGKTGTTISDSINFVFHASEFLSPKGRFYISDPLFSFIPEGIRDLFRQVNMFEGRDMKMMKAMKYNVN